MKVVTIVGARPQFIKAGPVSRALASAGIGEVLVHTGQHYDRGLSDVFFEQLRLRHPDHDLGVGSGPHGEQTGRMLAAIERVLLDEQPAWALVYGDTNSTVAGALAAAKLHIPVAHVESGLRSYNRTMPEEINRVVTDHLSSMLFCPTERAMANLAAEGLTDGCRLVGDVMYDSVLRNVRLAEEAVDPLAALGLRPGGYYLATVHRAGNTDDDERLGVILGLLAGLDRPAVLPLHPRTAAALRRSGIRADQGALRAIPPVPYLEMLLLERGAKAILTDSGGVQKEAYFFGVPCVTLRPETEWVETVEAGWNAVVDADAERFLAAVAAVVARGGDLPPFPATRESDVGALYGTGNAAGQIAQALLEFARPQERP
jgi:UDP-N-acetylglucosamine 2-epimerase